LSIFYLANNLQKFVRHNSGIKLFGDSSYDGRKGFFDYSSYHTTVAQRVLKTRDTLAAKCFFLWNSCDTGQT
jgi:hypothetical protein